MSETATALVNAIQSAGLQTTVTPKPTRVKFSDRRDGESFCAYENRMSERRESNRARMRDKRNALRTLAIDGATSILARNEANIAVSAETTVPIVHDGIMFSGVSSLGVESRVDKADAVNAAIPVRYQGRAVSVQTREEIIAGLTTKFSRGMSAPRYKVRRPQWQDADKQFYARFTRNQALYARGEHTSSTVLDPLRTVRLHDARTLAATSNWGEGHTVASTIAESLATGGQRSDAMGKVTGMSAGSVKLSDLWEKVEIEGIGKVLVNRETGNSIRPTDDVQTPVISVIGESFHANIVNEMVWTLTLAAWRYGALSARTQHGIKSIDTPKPVRDTVTLYPMYARAMVYGPLTRADSELASIR